MTDSLDVDRVLIVDDHSIVRDGLRAAVLSAAPACAVCEAASFAEALDQLGKTVDFDLVLLDLNIPGASRFSALEQLRRDFPSLPIVMISGSYDRATVHSAISAGAAGFLPKTLDRAMMLHALEEVLSGEIFVPEGLQDDSLAEEEAAIRARIESLTPQQRIVLGHLVSGRLNKQIAHDLNISMTTVKAHVSAILMKLNVLSRTQAVVMVNRVGLGD
ncbi:MAG: response regulator transcription factor [Erythrobacter sp.]|jgi:DNA-binding NarL/FixJ family response regulator|nr:response regulator transcription factor [Erythrobacter sp.]